jgi:hypothetical protein
MGVLFQAIAAGRAASILLGAAYTWALVMFVVCTERTRT